MNATVPSSQRSSEIEFIRFISTPIGWICLVLGVAVLCGPLHAGDWPAYRRDVQRSAVTDDKLTFPMQLAWQYTCAQAPLPAWRPAPKTINRMEFDYAPQPVVAGGIVCFGSSSDDTIRALDARTGEQRWLFTTGGPVRFAPQIADGKVYAASDDGCVYCLDAVTGKPVWTFRAAPADDRLLGDARMISRWPLRCGLLVDGGTVYTVAGMWPSEGIFIYALDAGTGKELWCNDTGGAPYGWEANTKSAYFFGNWTGLTPQGALLASRDILMVPMGRAVPAGIDRKTGRLLAFRPGQKGTGTGSPPFAAVGDAAFVYQTAQGGEQQSGILQFGKATGAGVAFKGLPQPSVREPGKGMDVTLLATKERFYARQGYSIALAGELLLVGEDGAIAAYEAKKTAPPAGNVRQARYDAATQRELWRFPVKGQARGLAVADGRIYVTTDRGEIYCFAAENDAQAQHHPALAFQAPQPHPLAAKMRDRLRAAGMDRGYALVLGDPEGTLAVGLAEQTALRIISVVSDEAAARALRARLVSSTALHGSRIHVFAAPKDGRLPFTQYFANAVLVAGDTGAVPAAELYRLLRPCGGILLSPGLSRPAMSALSRASGAPAAEIHEQEDLSIVRGPLPGALDWDSPHATDRHLRAPLRPLWFGGPAPMEFYDRIATYPHMLAANGRYFYLLSGSLVAVDAYNGTELWRRYVPRDLRTLTLDGEERLIDTWESRKVDRETDLAWRGRPSSIRALTADADSLYLTLDESCFRGAGVTCVKLSATTGEQQSIYGPVAASPEVSLKTPQTWTLKLAPAHEGTLTLSANADGLKLDLMTKAPAGTPPDSWTLYFDLRPAAQRYGLYERGVFQVQILPPTEARTSASWRKGRGAAFPELTVTGTRTSGGTVATVQLPWAQIEALTGDRPQTFGFAAALRAGELTPSRAIQRAHIKPPPPAERYLFADPMAEALNNGWATILLADAPANLAALRQSGIIAGPLEKLPGRVREKRQVDRDDPIEVAAAQAPRVHPLTGDLGPKLYQRGNGCGPLYKAANLQFMRSGTVGTYDLLDDSGIRQFGGVRPSCSQNMLAALGVLIVGEDGSDCTCGYSYQTSFVLAPAERRLHEDWATYLDTPVDNQLRMAAINLGALGDRRDADRTLWLNYPRFPNSGGFLITPGGEGRGVFNGVWPQTRYEFKIPLRVETAENLGPFRVNADRVAIRGTDRPWIYASQYRGITKATLQVDFRAPLVAQTAATAPQLDGQLNEPLWAGDPQSHLKFTKTDLFLRNDATHVYIGLRRPASFGRTGNQRTWKQTTSGEDAPVWNDDSFELFFSDRRSSVVVHLGLSASGARYDARAVEAGTTEDKGWSGTWKGAVVAGTETMSAEFAVPLSLLKDAGLDPGTLGINAQANVAAEKPTPNIDSEALCHLGGRGRSHCANFIPLGLGKAPVIPPRQFTVRLHFAELDESAKPGQRVFDVKLQDQVILKGFDVAKEAGGVRTALVKEFKHVPTTEALALEFIAAGGKLTAASAPILSALEVSDEGFKTASTPQPRFSK
jgi:outer membrane protein assembly factor BamB